MANGDCFLREVFLTPSVPLPNSHHNIPWGAEKEGGLGGRKELGREWAEGALNP